MYHLREGEERRYLDPKFEQVSGKKNCRYPRIARGRENFHSKFQHPEVREVLANITNWINHELGDSSTRIRVESLEADLFDGLVLKVLVSRLSGRDIVMPAGEFVQSEERQRINLKAVLGAIEEILGLPEENVK